MTSYFAQANPNSLPYGFVPEIYSLKTVVVSPGNGATPPAPATPAKAVVSPAPKDPADAALPGVAGTVEPGRGSEERAGSRDTSAPDVVTADGATGNGVGGAEKREQMPVTTVDNEEELESFVTAAGERLVLVDFGAEWCKNCKAILVSERIHNNPGLLGMPLGHRALFLVWWVLFEGRLLFSVGTSSAVSLIVGLSLPMLSGATVCTGTLLWRCEPVTRISAIFLTKYWTWFFLRALPLPTGFLVGTRADAVSAWHALLWGSLVYAPSHFSHLRRLRPVS